MAVDFEERKGRIEEIRLRARKVERQTVLMWRSIVRELSRVTPRYLTEGRYDIVEPLTDIELEGV